MPGAKKPDNPLPWMADLGNWNYLIGFGLIFVGLAVSRAHVDARSAAAAAWWSGCSAAS